jgi:hypothetical protein
MRGAPVEEIRDRLLESVTTWADPQFDDATLVVLRRKADPPP